MAKLEFQIGERTQDLTVVRRSFVRGQENILWFTNANKWHAFWEAREAAKFFAGISPDEQTQPYVATMGPRVGRIVGSQTRGGLRGWRLDLTAKDPRDPKKPQLLHLNWWDYTEDPEAEQRRNRAMWWRGANYVKGGEADLYYRIFEHFPNPISSPV